MDHMYKEGSTEDNTTFGASHPVPPQATYGYHRHSGVGSLEDEEVRGFQRATNLYQFVIIFALLHHWDVTLSWHFLILSPANTDQTQG